MCKETNIAKKIVLTITFVPSQNLLWDILTIAFGPCTFYPIFQFLFATHFALLGIFLTSDIQYFKNFFEKHSYAKHIFEIALHYSATLISFVITTSVCFISTLPFLTESYYDSEIKEAVEENKKLMFTQIQQMDNLPLELRTFFLAISLSLIVFLLTISKIISLTELSWVLEILNTFVALISFSFLIKNAQCID